MRQAICFDGASLIADIAVTGMILYVGWWVLSGWYSFSDYVLLASVAVLISKEIFSLLLFMQNWQLHELFSLKVIKS
jgi:hypothetical protein